MAEADTLDLDAIDFSTMSPRQARNEADREYELMKTRLAARDRQGAKREYEVLEERQKARQEEERRKARERQEMRRIIAEARKYVRSRQEPEQEKPKPVDLDKLDVRKMDISEVPEAWFERKCHLRGWTVEDWRERERMWRKMTEIARRTGDAEADAIRSRLNCERAHDRVMLYQSHERLEEEYVAKKKAAFNKALLPWKIVFFPIWGIWKFMEFCDSCKGGGYDYGEQNEIQWLMGTGKYADRY